MLKAGCGNFLPAAAVFVYLLAGIGCGERHLPPTGGNPSVPAPSATAVPEAGRDVVSTFTLVGHSEDGRRNWAVEGQTADLLSEVVLLEPVKAKSFGRTEVVLTARRGEFHKTSRDVHLEEEVVVTASDGTKLTTDVLDWKAEEQTATSPGWVTVTRPGMTVTGRGGTGFPKLKQVRLEKEVTMILSGEGEPGETVITCDGPMEVDTERNRARFWRNVRVRDSRGTIEADRMDVAFEEGTNQLEKTAFWGHVRIEQEGRTATAHRAVYWQRQ